MSDARVRELLNSGLPLEAAESLAAIEDARVAAFVASDASEAHALNSTFSDTEVEGALNALGTKINAVIDALIAAGLMDAS